MVDTEHVEQSILGISFDGLAISGIVNEFVNLAAIFKEWGYRILFDPGFEITMGRTTDTGWSGLPTWVEIVSCVGQGVPLYDRTAIELSIDCIQQGKSVTESVFLMTVCEQLVAAFMLTFRRHNVRFLTVENGTLPDNPLFTEALFIAINKYGTEAGLGKYVLWRDHDLMWSTEPHLHPPFPYPGVRRPALNPHIQHAVATEWMRLRMEAWATDTDFAIIPNRFELRAESETVPTSLRSHYGIPSESYLIARCTRVIPVKCIERDLLLFDALQGMLSEIGSERRIYLFVTGPVEENSSEYERLRQIEKGLSIAGQVIWADGLLPFNRWSVVDSHLAPCHSIRDLLEEADLSSFLTIYDYEGFGNPPGEAMAAGIPFIATTYELYHEVYGSKGAIAPLLPINRDSTPDDPFPEEFLTWVMQILQNPEERSRIVAHNIQVCQRHYSLEALERQISKLFPQMSAQN